MANLHLVTGYAGKEHITSGDQGSFNAAIMGAGEFVLERGKQFAAQIISNNTVRVFDGDLLMQGRHIRLKEDTYVDLFFENGKQGYKRTDLIAVRYEKDAITDVENANLVVIKGVPSEDSYVVPEKITGDIINDHALQNDTVLYQVNFDGIGIQEPEKVFPTLSTIEKELENIKNDMLKNIEKYIQEQIDNLKNPGTLKNIIGNAEYADGKMQQGLIKEYVSKGVYGATPSPEDPIYTLTILGDRRKLLKEYITEQKHGSLNYSADSFDYGYDWRYVDSYTANDDFQSSWSNSDPYHPVNVELPVYCNKLGTLLFLNFFIAERTRKDTTVVSRKTNINNKIGQACVCVPMEWIFASTFERYRISQDDTDVRPGNNKIWSINELNKMLLPYRGEEKDENILAYINIPIVRNFNSNNPTYDNIVGALIVDRQGYLSVTDYGSEDPYGHIGSLTFKLPKKTVKGTDLSIHTGTHGADGSTWYEVYAEVYNIGFTTKVLFGSFTFKSGER